MEPTIFFTSPPNFGELCGVTVLVKPCVQPQLASVQLHITKCREIIFTEPDVIASPSCDLDACFNIVMQSLFKTGRVQARLQKLGCQLSKPYRVLPSLYQACLHYTILARLAPIWNRAGEWLLQELRLCVNKDEMFVSVNGTVARFPPLQVEDLNLSREEMLQIVKCTEDGVNEVMLADSWCHVLPSMKRGRIVYVSLNISRHGPFTSYRDLQRHWKNMYGYRLPDTDEDILYCQVCFLPSGGGKYFTYPSVCLRAGPLQVVQRVDPKPILTTFLQDVHSRVGAACGTSLRFQPKICFACPSLHIAGEETSQISLSSKPVSRQVAPMRSQKSVSQLCDLTNTDKKATIREQLYEQKTEKTKQDISLVNVAQKERRLTNEPEKPVEENHGKDNLSSYTVRKITNNQIITQQDGRDNTICILECNASVDQKQNSSLQIQVATSDREQHINKQTVMTTKYVPQFRPKQRCHLDRKEPACDNSDRKISKSSIFKPVFKPCPSKATPSSSKKDKKEAQSSETNTAIYQSPSSKLCLVKNKTVTARASEQDSSQHTLPVSVPHFRNNLKHKSLKDAHTKPALPKTSVVSSSDFKSVAERTKQQSQRSMKSPNVSHLILPAQRRNNILLPPVLSVSKTSTVSSASGLKIATERTIQQSPRSAMKSPNVADLHLKAYSSNILLTPARGSVSLTREPPMTPLMFSTSSQESDLKIPTERTIQQSPRSAMKSPNVADLHLKAYSSNILLTPARGSVSLTREPPMTPLMFSTSSQESNGWCKDGTQDRVKRKKGAEGEDTPKKPRVKPQIQDLDVETLARSNQLGKANTVTLTAWLKDRGVMCRAKDKKNDLMEKVNSYIHAGKPQG